jgi:hypothetical protein
MATEDNGAIRSDQTGDDGGEEQESGTLTKPSNKKGKGNKGIFFSVAKTNFIILFFKKEKKSPTVHLRVN